jgi:poly-gamma-glutamate synthesis protein (capsule biosynthesis protein)
VEAAALVSRSVVPAQRLTAGPVPCRDRSKHRFSGYEQYRDELVLMFFPSLNPVTGQLVELRITPMQIRKIRVNRASSADARWVCDTLNRVSRAFGVHAALMSDGTLKLRA